jgi:hypothetical protein
MYDEEFVERARECFRQAAEDTGPGDLRLLIELGLEFLRLAQRDDKGGNADEVRFRLH